MTNPTKKETQLNPFTFPTETDGRYLLLVLIIAGLALGLILQLLYAYTRIESGFVLLAIAIGGVILFFLWTWKRTKIAVNKEIDTEGWSPFPPVSTHPSEQEGLNSLQDNLEQTVNCLSELEESVSPRFIWDENDHAVTGRAFGYGQRQYILLPRGMYDAFVLQYKNYQAILLHELGHIANRDVSKTMFSIQLGRSFYKMAFIGIALLYLYGGYNTIQIFLTDGLTDWQYFWSISEATIKFLLVMILIEVIRSSILRVREYYADARAVMWMGTQRHLRDQVLSCNDVPIESNGGWHSIKHWLRQSVVPLHPKVERRLSMLHDSRGLFRPSLEVALLAGIQTGLAVNGNFSLISKLVPNLMMFSNQLVDPIVQGSTTSATPLILSILVDIGTVALSAGIFVIFGVFPIAATVGIQIQKAAFADAMLAKGKRLLSSSKLFLISLLLGLGTVAGFILTPIPEALSIGTFFVRMDSLLRTPFILAGWTILFFLWLLPLRGLAGQVYTSHSDNQTTAMKRKWLMTISILGLLPTMLVMSLTQIVLTSSKFFNGNIPEASKLLLIGFLFAVWGIALSLTLFVWIGAWFVMTKRGWRKPKQRDVKDGLSTWAVQSTSITLPNPPSFQLPMEAPPPL